MGYTWVGKNADGDDSERRAGVDKRHEGYEVFRIQRRPSEASGMVLVSEVVNIGSPSHLSGACKLARKGLQVTCLPQGSARPPKPRNTTSSLLPPLN